MHSKTMISRQAGYIFDVVILFEMMRRAVKEKSYLPICDMTFLEKRHIAVVIAVRMFFMTEDSLTTK